MRDGAGRITPARCERVLKTTWGMPSGPGPRAPIVERGIGGGRHEPVAADDLDQLGNGAGVAMLVERFPPGS